MISRRKSSHLKTAGGKPRARRRDQPAGERDRMRRIEIEAASGAVFRIEHQPDSLAVIGDDGAGGGHCLDRNRVNGIDRSI
jgi:hypothetical protein